MDDSTKRLMLRRYFMPPSIITITTMVLLTLSCLALLIGYAVHRTSPNMMRLSILNMCIISSGLPLGIISALWIYGRFARQHESVRLRSNATMLFAFCLYIILLIISVLSETAIIIFDIFVLILVALWFYVYYGVINAQDDDVDTWFEEDMNQLAERSLRKFGLEYAELMTEPLIITGPVVWETIGIPSNDLIWRRGKDGISRFAIYQVTIIHLTNHFLGAYVCDFNFLKFVALNEKTFEYHYRDIVSVTTEEVATSYTLPNGVSIVHARAFCLRVANGEINVSIGSQELEEITGGELPETGAEKAVQVIRTMLRSRR